MHERVGDMSLSLIDRVRARNPEAWKRLVRLYGPLVYHWCRYDCGLGEDDAQDVGQEVFSAVHRSIDGFRGDRVGDTFRGWLWTITLNEVRDLVRRREPRSPSIGGSDHLRRLQDLPEPVGPPDSSLTDEGSLCRRALDLIRNEFEERTWRAFWRTTVDDQKSTFVAEELGMSAMAVRKAKSRVLGRLRQELNGLVDLD